MTKTISTVTRLVAAIDWRAVGDRLDRALELAWTIAQLLLTAAVLLSEVIWEHRAHIRQALVTAIAATFVAGQWTRQQLDRIAGQIEQGGSGPGKCRGHGGQWCGGWGIAPCD